MKYETLRRYFGDMPPLDHYPLRDYREFRWEDSEILDYLVDRPRFLDRVLESLRESGAIVFDPETRTWRGYRFQAEDDCCQKSPSKVFFSSTMPLSKTQSPLYERETGGICDGGQSPNPLLTAAGNSDSDGRTENGGAR